MKLEKGTWLVKSIRKSLKASTWETKILLLIDSILKDTLSRWEDSSDRSAVSLTVHRSSSYHLPFTNWRSLLTESDLSTQNRRWTWTNGRSKLQTTLSARVKSWQVSPIFQTGIVTVSSWSLICKVLAYFLVIQQSILKIGNCSESKQISVLKEWTCFT